MMGHFCTKNPNPNKAIQLIAKHFATNNATSAHCKYKWRRRKQKNEEQTLFRCIRFCQGERFVDRNRMDFTSNSIRRKWRYCINWFAQVSIRKDARQINQTSKTMNELNNKRRKHKIRALSNRSYLIQYHSKIAEMTTFLAGSSTTKYLFHTFCCCCFLWGCFVRTAFHISHWMAFFYW